MVNLKRRDVLASGAAAIVAPFVFSRYGNAAGKAVRTIIVGGGSAGACLAARLSEKPGREVLLIEAGATYAADAVPAKVAQPQYIGPGTGFDWGYSTIADPHGHKLFVPRGKVLGGCSAVNASVFMRGSQFDYARWAEHGATQWKWPAILDAFRKMEKSSLPGAWHNDQGPTPVVQIPLEKTGKLQQAFAAAAQAGGAKTITDFNGPDRIGVGAFPMNVVDGMRVNAAMAYLTEAVRKRSNLQIRGDATVDRVLMQGTKATGVRLASGETIPADEVILSAGTLCTPGILLRSGIGPAADLKKLGIALVADLPVGQGVRDHIMYNASFALDPAHLPDAGPVNVVVQRGSHRARPGQTDMQISCRISPRSTKSPTGAEYVFTGAVVATTSRGTIRIPSVDPAAMPIIDLNLMATDDDKARTVELIKWIRTLASAKPLAAVLGVELVPGPSIQSDAEILAAAHETLGAHGHMIASAVMGPRGKGVVDQLGKVHGIEGLRVVDSSIFPELPSAALNPTTIMGAEFIAARMA